MTCRGDAPLENAKHESMAPLFAPTPANAFGICQFPALGS